MEKYIILYTTTDDCPVKARLQNDAFGTAVVSNTYVNGIGRLEFDAPVKRIGYRAFGYCENLKSIIIPDTVINIGKEAFKECENLEQVTLCEGLSNIGWCAFDGCRSLKSVVIPESVVEIGAYAFNACSLQEINIPKNIVLHGHAFANCNGISSVTIPKRVKFAGGNPFSGCRGLELFKGEYVSEDGFCIIVDGVLISFAPSDIAVYTPPVGVTSIGRGAFAYSEELLHVCIPEGVVSIEDFAFAGCSNLETISIRASVESIGLDAFEGCSNIRRVYISDLKKWFGVDFDDYDRTTPMHAGALLVLNGKPVTSIVVPDDITVINSMSFCGCLSLRDLHTNNVVSIDYGAFMECQCLEKVIMPGCVESIGECAFLGCINLDEIIIPSSVTSIGAWAFAHCTNLKDVYCKATVPPKGDCAMFEYNAPGFTIYVPMSSVDAYREADYWSGYAEDIIGYDF